MKSRLRGFMAALCLFLVPVAVLADNLIIGGPAASGTFEKRDDNGALISTGTLAVALYQHSAVKLTNGSIFVAGGAPAPGVWQILDQNGNVLSSGSLTDQRVSAAATLLNNGNVYLAGGTNSPYTWEIHSPTGALVASGNLSNFRGAGVRALALQNGNIWVSGAQFGGSDGGIYEIYNSSGAFLTSGSLVNQQYGSQAKVLQSGNVILAGGDGCTGCYEIHTETGSLVSSGSLSNAFNSGANSVLLTSGNVFIFGSCIVAGCKASGSPGVWEIRTGTGAFVSTGTLADTRDSAGVALLTNGNVFITGGNAVPSVWEIRTSAGALVSTGSLSDSRTAGHTVTHF